MDTLLETAPLTSRDAAATRAIRTILTHVAPGGVGAQRLAAAAALARRLDASLYGVSAAMVPPLGAVDPTGLAEGEWFAVMREQLTRDLEASQEDFRAAAAGLRAEWSSAEAMPAEALARASRAADLIVLGGESLGTKDAYRHADPAEVMMHAGRPVLVAPPGAPPLTARAVVVGWKDTREARRAVADALPLMARAETVLVTEVCAASEREDALVRTRDVGAWLARHGIPTHARVVLADPDRVVTELNVAAEAIGADLIVTGGYGHSRLGEWAFGGVTRDLLTTPERYVLLSH
jgi:nucleotide-binding universal stress UspA family protein